MTKKIDLMGMSFTRLNVIAAAGSDKHGYALWLCKCACGNETTVSSNALRSGHTRSCGCYGRDARRKANTTHGGSGSLEFKSWRAMRERCNNPNHIAYRNYGGRGIKICKRWNEFANFLKDMGPKPTPQHSIERRHNDSDYSPKNCFWATAKEQNNNKRRASGVQCPNCNHVFDVMENWRGEKTGDAR